MTLEPIDPSTSPVVVTHVSFLTPARINSVSIRPGSIEYLCTLSSDVGPRKLYDGSFEGLSPYKFAYLKETDFRREKPWYPAGATNRALHSVDRTSKVSGDSSHKIVAPETVPCTGGVAQDGIAVERGVACDFSCYLRQSGLKSPVRVMLHREETVPGVRPSCPRLGAWQKYHAPVGAVGERCEHDADDRIPRARYALAGQRFACARERCRAGVADVVAAVAAMRPGIIRFGWKCRGNGAGDFEWRDTIGDPDRRRPFRAWGGLQPTGPGLEEIVQFCQLVGAEPLICVRITRKRTPQDAADQVQYFNGRAVETLMGMMRARNGHPEPYRIRYWQVANGCRGHEYEQQLPAFFARP